MSHIHTIEKPRHTYPASNDIPNNETVAAIEEARSGKPLETLDIDHFDEFVASL